VALQTSSLKKIPIPDFTGKQIQELSSLHKDLSKKENDDFLKQSTDIISVIDKEIVSQVINRMKISYYNLQIIKRKMICSLCYE
jgi:hypothetical protein